METKGKKLGLRTKGNKGLNGAGVSSSLWPLHFSLYVTFNLFSLKTRFLPFSTPQGEKYGIREPIASQITIQTVRGRLHNSMAANLEAPGKGYTGPARVSRPLSDQPTVSRAGVPL